MPELSKQSYTSTATNLYCIVFAHNITQMLGTMGDSSKETKLKKKNKVVKKSS